MKEASSNLVHLSDYQPSDFQIESIQLIFRLFEEGAEVVSSMTLKRRKGALVDVIKLDGEELELRSVKLDGKSLSPSEYSVDEESLTLSGLGEKAEIEISTWIKPQDNKRLEGLYKSASMFCTQCEAEGFRRITYYLDRPDVMALFETRIEAEKSRYPILLSNGNPIDSGELEGGRHFVTWQDPFPKPCYLFALVAGDLHCQKDRFTTCNGRDVDLQIYVDHKNADKCDYALDCLKRSMTWDEQTYGREYDLDIFMIVAVDDFNMGAMENKGLNIFNSSCVLAKTDTTTDAGYQRIEAIVAHEYFHNWSGNRVTCRDWFQLSLKEGFTVFRDAEFSADMNSREVKRIEDVNLLRTAQFAEDAGPMSHPVRPASYMEISNFYTLTVYEKGAELVGMLRTLLGAESFRKGSDLYFERHDGQAVTTDDFVAAMAEVSGRDLSQFKLWYEQSGTPQVHVRSSYDAAAQRYVLHFTQSCPPTPGQSEKQPFHIPLALGLLAKDGTSLPLAQANGERTWVYELREAEATVSFDGISQEPVPSLLRGFSAPVKLSYDYSDEQLLFLMANDIDGFNRWDAGQLLATRVLQRLVANIQSGERPVAPTSFIRAFDALLKDTRLDKAMLCKLLMLPTESYLIEISEVADVDAIHEARESLRKALAVNLHASLLKVYVDNHDADSGNRIDGEAMAKRALKNAVLAIMSADSGAEFTSLAEQQFASASCMTDSLGALSALVNSGQRGVAETALAAFYSRWEQDAQVMEQWLAVQASSQHFADLDKVKTLMAHRAFQLSNPNKVRSLIGMFCNQNHTHFHHVSGQGYSFLADQVIALDDMNPQVASRLLTPLTRWRKYDEARQQLMIEQLRRIYSKDKLSKDVRELLEKSLPD